MHTGNIIRRAAWFAHGVLSFSGRLFFEGQNLTRGLGFCRIYHANIHQSAWSVPALVTLYQRLLCTRGPFNVNSLDDNRGNLRSSINTQQMRWNNAIGSDKLVKGNPSS